MTRLKPTVAWWSFVRSMDAEALIQVVAGIGYAGLMPHGDGP